MPTISQTISKIYQFAHLPVGWHFGDGGPISVDIIEQVHGFLLKADDWGIDEANAFPGMNGQIEVTVYGDDLTTAFLFEEDGSVSITEESKCEIISDVYGRPYSAAEQKLWKSQNTQIISDLFTWSSGTPETRDLEAALSRVLLEGSIRNVGSQSSAQAAYWNPTELFVSMSDTSTVPS